VVGMRLRFVRGDEFSGHRPYPKPRLTRLTTAYFP